MLLNDVIKAVSTSLHLPKSFSFIHRGAAANGLYVVLHAYFETKKNICCYNLECGKFLSIADISKASILTRLLNSDRIIDVSS